jgi:hypothetical protein
MKSNKTTCPHNDVFIKALFSELGENEKESFVDHIFCCSKCRLKFDAVKALNRECRQEGKDIPDETLTSDEAKSLRKMAAGRLRELGDSSVRFPVFRPGRPGLKWIYAASLFLAVVVIGYLLLNSPPDQKIFRTTNPNELRLSKPIGNIKEPPSIFKWSPVKNANVYFFKLLDEDLQVLWDKSLVVSSKSGPSVSSLVLDETIKNKLKRGKTYVWTVAAFDDDNLKLAEARGYFIIEPPPIPLTLAWLRTYPHILISDDDERGPVSGVGIFRIQHGNFSKPQSASGRISPDHKRIEILHQARRRFVVCQPEARNDRPRAGKEEGERNAHQSFAFFNPSGAAIACRQNHDIRVQLEVEQIEGLE